MGIYLGNNKVAGLGGSTPSSSSDLIFEKELTEETASIVIDNLDLEKDGVYELYLNTTNVGGLTFIIYRINDVTDAKFNNRYTVNNSADSFYAQHDEGVNYGVVGASTSSAQPVFSRAIFTLNKYVNTDNCSVNSICECYMGSPINLYHVGSGYFNADTPVTNLTKLTLTNQNGGVFRIGTKVRLYKRG